MAGRAARPTSRAGAARVASNARLAGERFAKPGAARLAALVDRYHEKREERLRKEKEVAALQAEETKLRGALLDGMKAAKLSSIGGKLARVELTPKLVPVVVNWDVFHRHIANSGDFDLLTKRLGEDAIRARWEAGETVPGIEPTMTPVLSRPLKIK